MQRVLFGSEAFLLFVLCLVDLAFLTYAISTLSISYYEAQIFYNSPQISGILARFFVGIFGQNDYALRFAFMLCHICSIILLYKISKPILKRKFDRVICVVAFIMLPATMASAVLVNDAGVVILLTLLSIYLYQLDLKILFYILITALAFVTGAFLIFFIAIFAFGLYKRDSRMTLAGVVLFVLCFYLNVFDSDGKPRGYLLDTISIFALAFSPPLFIYFVYTLYRIWIKESKDILWFICIVAFLLCIVFSIRQRLFLENFLPFCTIAMPLIIRTFFSSYRVKLPMFRHFYNTLAGIVSVCLLFGFFIVIFNEQIYHILIEPKRHFAYGYHMAKELSNELKQIGVNSIHTTNKRLALRLKFYRIKNSNELMLVETKDGDIKIQKSGVTIARFNIQKIKE